MNWWCVKIQAHYDPSGLYQHLSSSLIVVNCPTPSRQISILTLSWRLFCSTSHRHIFDPTSDLKELVGLHILSSAVTWLIMTHPTLSRCVPGPTFGQLVFDSTPSRIALYPIFGRKRFGPILGQRVCWLISNCIWSLHGLYIKTISGQHNNCESVSLLDQSF